MIFFFFSFFINLEIHGRQINITFESDFYINVTFFLKKSSAKLTKFLFILTLMYKVWSSIVQYEIEFSLLIHPTLVPNFSYATYKTSEKFRRKEKWRRKYRKERKKWNKPA